MKILYVHFRQAKTDAQVKAVADKVKILKEVSKSSHSFTIPIQFCFIHLYVGADGLATLGHTRDIHS